MRSLVFSCIFVVGCGVTKKRDDHTQAPNEAQSFDLMAQKMPENQRKPAGKPKENPRPAPKPTLEEQCKIAYDLAVIDCRKLKFAKREICYANAYWQYHGCLKPATQPPQTPPQKTPTGSEKPPRSTIGMIDDAAKAAVEACARWLGSEFRSTPEDSEKACRQAVEAKPAGAND
jgi:hypothetical protein